MFIFTWILCSIMYFAISLMLDNPRTSLSGILILKSFLTFCDQLNSWLMNCLEVKKLSLMPALSTFNISSRLHTAFPPPDWLEAHKYLYCKLNFGKLLSVDLAIGCKGHFIHLYVEGRYHIFGKVPCQECFQLLCRQLLVRNIVRT